MMLACSELSNKLNIFKTKTAKINKLINLKMYSTVLFFAQKLSKSIEILH